MRLVIYTHTLYIGCQQAEAVCFRQRSYGALSFVNTCFAGRPTFSKIWRKYYENTVKTPVGRLFPQAPALLKLLDVNE